MLACLLMLNESTSRLSLPCCSLSQQPPSKQHLAPARPTSSRPAWAPGSASPAPPQSGSCRIAGASGSWEAGVGVLDIVQPNPHRESVLAA